jgi:exoribonuclease R
MANGHLTHQRVQLLRCLHAPGIYEMVRKHNILTDWPNSLYHCCAALAQQWTPEIENDLFNRLRAQLKSAKQEN